MTDGVRRFARVAVWALPAWALLLFLGTLTHQPDPQTAFADFAAYVTTDRFLVSHLVNSIAGAVAGSIGVIGVMLLLQASPAGGRALAGTLAFTAGNVLTASIFGVAAFAQPALGRAHIAGRQDALALYNEIYAAPLFLTAAVALVLVILSGVLTGIAVSRSSWWPRWTGWLFAISTTGFVVSNFAWPLGQSVFSLLLIGATTRLAWSDSSQT